MRRVRTFRRYRIPPSKRFPLWFVSSSGFTVRVRDDRPAPAHLVRLYIAAPGTGRYWLAWSRNLERFLADRNLERMKARYPELEPELAGEIRAHLARLDGR